MDDNLTIPRKDVVVSSNRPTLETFRNNHDLYFAFFDFWFGFKPHNYQKKFLLDCLHGKRVAGVWCRQSGKSTCLAHYLLFKALITGEDAMITAATQTQSAELYLKIKRVIEGNELLMSQLVRFTQTELELKPHARIKALPTGPEGKAVRGFTAMTIVQEEAGLTSDEITNKAITPLIASKKDDGQIIKIGTPLKKNHFYTSLYTDATYMTTHITWREAVAAGQFTQAFIDEQRRNLTDVEFRTEYEAEFIEEQASFFPLELIEKSMEDYKLLTVY